RTIILRPELDPGDVLELHELGALAGHGQLAEFPRGLEFAQRPNRELAPRRFDPARRYFDIAGDDRVLDVLHGEAARRQPVGLHPYAHRVAPLPEDAGAADARQALEPGLHDSVGDIGELHQVVVVAAQRQPEEWLRVGRLLRDHRLEHVHRQPAAHARHLVTHVLRGHVDGAVEVELEGDLAVLLRGGARQRAQSLDRGELLFEHVGDRRLYHLRVRAGQRGRDRDDRRIDVGELAHRQAGVPDDTEQHERGGDHARQHRSADRRLRESHRARKLTEKGDPGSGPGCQETVGWRRTTASLYDDSACGIPTLRASRRLASPGRVPDECLTWAGRVAGWSDVRHPYNNACGLATPRLLRAHQTPQP